MVRSTVSPMDLTDLTAALVELDPAALVPAERWALVELLGSVAAELASANSHPALRGRRAQRPALRLVHSSA